MFENYYSFFHYCLLSCRYAMIQKSILIEPKWGGHKQSFVGDGAPGLIVATALATTTKNDNPVGNFVNSRRRVARNSQWGGCFGVLGAEPPAAGCQWGSGGEAPSAGGWGFGGKAPSRRRHGCLGAEPPALENFAFFLQK